MLAQIIKQALGEQLAAQVEQALQGKGKDGKDLELVCGNDGSFVPADKYEKLREDLTSLQQSTEKLGALAKRHGGSGQPEELPKELEDAIASIQSHYDEKLLQQRFDMALEEAVNGVEDVKSKKALQILARENKEKMNLDETGRLQGFDKLLQELREQEKDLFGFTTNQQTCFSGASPAQASRGNPASELDTVRQFMGL